MLTTDCGVSRSRNLAVRNPSGSDPRGRLPRRRPGRDRPAADVGRGRGGRGFDRPGALLLHHPSRPLDPGVSVRRRARGRIEARIGATCPPLNGSSGYWWSTSTTSPKFTRVGYSGGRCGTTPSLIHSCVHAEGDLPRAGSSGLGRNRASAARPMARFRPASTARPPPGG